MKKCDSPSPAAVAGAANSVPEESTDVASTCTNLEQSLPPSSISEVGGDLGDAMEIPQTRRPITCDEQERQQESVIENVPQVVCMLTPAEAPSELLQQRADSLVTELAVCQVREAGLRQQLAGILSMLGRMEPYYD